MLDQLAVPSRPIDVPAGMTLRVTATAEATIVTVRGDVDLAALGRLRGRLGEELDLAPRALVLDLTGVGFCGSGGITELLVAASEAHVSGVPFAIAADRRPVLRPIRVLGLDHVLPIHGSVAAALDWLAVLPRLLPGRPHRTD
ncbi:STAS domain-containing protein [Amycolatopsis vancoresmycina]|uniref:Anti-anti-sigma factor n=1 Tax=Amycolatopsis vancoresmycina DSM 44592 TaxID=1292037 RepID=R1G3I4_9PSEU|nr:STAS domain-containing protein [Amycolatopsis vancoresmycina]EOD66043.1 anti-anti-sigma factor [Amycolatopsis vancoresmycina DSM 44592]